MKTGSKIALALGAVVVFLFAKKDNKVSGVGYTTGARIIDRIELFSNCDSAEEIKELIEDYIEDNLGHIVEDRREAHQYFKKIYGDNLEYVDVHFGDSQYSNFHLDKEDEHGNSPLIRVVIDEIIVDGGSDDYCYIVRVEEE